MEIKDHNPYLQKYTNEYSSRHNHLYCTCFYIHTLNKHTSCGNNSMEKSEFYNRLETMTLRESISEWITASGIPPKRIASDLGISYSYLLRKLNVNDSDARIHVDELFPLIVAVCGRTPATPPLPLLWLAHRLGFDVLPFGYSEPDAPTTDRECLQTNQCVAKVHQLIMEKAPPTEVHSAVTAACIDLMQDATSHHRDWNKAHGLPENEGIPNYSATSVTGSTTGISCGNITISIGGGK